MSFAGLLLPQYEG